MDMINSILQLSEQTGFSADSLFVGYTLFVFVYLVCRTAVFAAVLFGLNRLASWLDSRHEHRQQKPQKD